MHTGSPQGHWLATGDELVLSLHVSEGFTSTLIKYVRRTKPRGSANLPADFLEDSGELGLRTAVLTGVNGGAVRLTLTNLCKARGYWLAGDPNDANLVQEARLPVGRDSACGLALLLTLSLRDVEEMLACRGIC